MMSVGRIENVAVRAESWKLYFVFLCLRTRAIVESLVLVLRCTRRNILDSLGSHAKKIVFCCLGL